MAKKIVFGSDFMIYGAPFYKWYRFTYGAVTHGDVVRASLTARNRSSDQKDWNKSSTTLQVST